MDKVVLRKWLEAGYVEDGITYPSRKGTPQEGIISPTLANMTLDGLEKVVRSAVPRRSRVNFIRYADDFVVTGKSKRLLEERVKPAVERFLVERGLTLSTEKTKITYIRNGFTFLGQTVRKFGRILRIKPAKEGVISLIRKVGTIIRKRVRAPILILIKELNHTLRGWANYHRHVVSSEAFSRIDTYVFEQLWRMLRKRHPRKSKRWFDEAMSWECVRDLDIMKSIILIIDNIAKQSTATPDIVELVSNVRNNYDWALEAIREGKAH